VFARDKRRQFLSGFKENASNGMVHLKYSALNLITDT
jgi:hypothetical protein